MELLLQAGGIGVGWEPMVYEAAGDMPGRWEGLSLPLRAEGRSW